MTTVPGERGTAVTAVRSADASKTPLIECKQSKLREREATTPERGEIETDITGSGSDGNRAWM
jgi:hypothetical protein